MIHLKTQYIYFEAIQQKSDFWLDKNKYNIMFSEQNLTIFLNFRLECSNSGKFL